MPLQQHPSHPARPRPRVVPPARPAELVLHVGGPRHGQVDRIPTDQLRGRLVYAGPRWIGVYRRIEPVRTRSTPYGAAQVWVVDEGDLLSGPASPAPCLTDET
ncbi:Hypothetical protein KLENKIAIHU_2083 [Klenkia terrae]|nr:Hypothetical protein KLENKIAIHU_2083 [Klenkia terrae]